MVMEIIQSKAHRWIHNKGLGEKQRKERQKRKDYVNTLLDLPVPSERLPDWVRQHREYNNNFNAWYNTLPN